MNDRTHSIVLIYPYFGEFAWHLEYFLHTCGFNPTVDFLIITDNTSPLNLPENVRVIYQSLDQVKVLAESRLQCSLAVSPQPFKFCDFRPAFGLIFQDYIQDYDFWGHGDLDVIFGRIRAFMTPELLNAHDIICLRPDYISSWFTLYRNTSRVNELFSLSRDYQTVFTTARYFNFDETNFTFGAFADGFSYQQIPSDVESMTHLVKRMHDEQYITAYFDLHAIEGLTGRIKWENGRLSYRNQYEVLLYHLIQFKKVFNPQAAPRSIPDKFYISPTRIYS